MFDFTMTNIEDAAQGEDGVAAVQRAIDTLDRCRASIKERSWSGMLPDAQNDLAKLDLGLQSALVVLRDFMLSLGEA